MYNTVYLVVIIMEQNVKMWIDKIMTEKFKSTS